MDDKQLAIEIRTAIKQGDADKVVALIGSDRARLDMMTVFGTWLHVAASMGQLEIVKRLVALGADVNRQGGVSASTPLDHAAAEGHRDVIEYLLSCGAMIDVSAPEKNPLFAAIHGGHTAVAKLLIDRGIDTQVKYTTKTKKDTDALAFAREWGRTEIVKLLTASHGREATMTGDDERPQVVPSGGSPGGPVDFTRLRREIAEAARRAFDAVRAAHPDEVFYAFALYSDDSAMTVCPAANTEQGYSRSVQRFKPEDWYRDNPALRGIPLASWLSGFRWATTEWEHECSGGEHFNALCKMLNQAGLYDEEDPEGFARHKGQVFACMVLGLADLNRSRFFGTDDAQNAVTLLCSVSDSGCAVWLEEESARFLNPAKVFEAFWNQRMQDATFADDFRLHCSDPDSVYQAFMAHLQGEEAKPRRADQD